MKRGGVMFVVVDIFSRAMDISVNYLRPCCAFSGTGRLEPLSEAHSSARVVATHSKHFYDISVSPSGNNVLLRNYWFGLITGQFILLAIQF